VNRCICVTKRDYIGLVSPLVEVGDQVGLVFGADVPVILRRLRMANEATYQFVCDAFILDLMHGEST
jgi:hypothetical protein